MVITEDTHPMVGEVLWVWSEAIQRNTDLRDNRWFYLNGGIIKIRDVEVPLSVHDKKGRTIGLMLPKVIAHLNGIYAMPDSFSKHVG